MTIDEPGYFERLARVEASHWWSIAMWRLAADWLAPAIRGRSGLAALDVGCGSGLTLVRLAGLPEIGHVIGLEPNPEALRLARRHGREELIQGSALDLPFASARFDVLTCFDVLQHLPDGGDRRAASEVFRVLRPGGVAIVRSNASGFGPGRSRGGTAYRLGELRAIFAGTGLTVLKASYVNTLPALAQEVRGRLRIVAGRRGREWRSHPSGGGLRIDVPSPRVNAWMGAVAACERRAMGFFHVPMPFGHSTLVLARKQGGPDAGRD